MAAKVAGTGAAEVVGVAAEVRVAGVIQINSQPSSSYIVRPKKEQEEKSCQDLTEVDQWVPEQ